MGVNSRSIKEGDPEIWVIIKKFPSYKISSYGRVLVIKTGRFRKPRFITEGYTRMALSRKNKLHQHSLHRLVALAFIPNPENKPEVNHKDRDKTNPYAYNLEWVTSSENQLHAVRNGVKIVRGVEVGSAILTESDVKAIRLLTGTQKEIAKKYNVCQQRISSIIRRKTWAHVL